ncbi:MAG: DUF5615 family PIN-like protein [Acidimicrobiales bacterium]
MRFLLDENQSPAIVGLLQEAGHDAVHVRQVGRAGAPDEDVFAFAAAERRVILSGDTDFGELLARSNASGPSLVLLRRQGRRRAAEVASLLLANLDVIAADLEAGAIVVFDEDRIRIRSLPLSPN